MTVNRVQIFYFSPTGGTEKVAKLIGAALKGADAVYTDITVPNQDKFELGAEDLAVFCVPVYGGRVPSPAAERMSRITGRDTPAALAAVFGNRAVDDALYELRDMAKPRGFRTVAAGEFVAPHSLNTNFGAGRPDAADMKVIEQFGAGIMEKLRKDELAEISVPGNANYRQYDGVPVKPSASLRCVRCGACAANCPAGAIDFINPRLTDKNTCISCMRCVKICPKGARHVSAPIKAAVSMKLKGYCAGRKEDKLYL